MLLFSGCMQLPEYARPRLHGPDEETVSGREGFAYRALTLADFQAQSLPEAYEGYDHHINAHSCISIRPTPDSTARIAKGVYEGREFYIGTISRVGFEAIFVPSCSWWNPAVPAGAKDYVLQHEQVHFGLAELAARDLTERVREEFDDYMAIDNSSQAVQQELAGQMHSWARAAMEESLERHTEFDNDTSLFYDPRGQDKWYTEVKERLARGDEPNQP